MAADRQLQPPGSSATLRTNAHIRLRSDQNDAGVPAAIEKFVPRILLKPFVSPSAELAPGPHGVLDGREEPLGVHPAGERPLALASCRVVPPGEPRRRLPVAGSAVVHGPNGGRRKRGGLPRQRDRQKRQTTVLAKVAAKQSSESSGPRRRWPDSRTNGCKA